MNDNDIAISVRNLTKAYRIFGHPGDRIKQALTFGRVHYHREFSALKDISFDIEKGETVGIIGRNGSGKSTLLQLICGILKPTTGMVQVRGRVSALLELGAGFNPEFTGRENVYFQGALMGYAHEQMDERFEEIESFAEIGEFIDQPVRIYSSGMFVRLAFAVAVHVGPEILVVDEALAVGDTLFQKRCYERIAQMQKNGLTLVLVSHDQELIRGMTSKALLLAAGAQLFFGETQEAIRYYSKVLFDEDTTHMANGTVQAGVPARGTSDGECKEYGYGIGGAKILGLRIAADDGLPRSHFYPGERINFTIEVVSEGLLNQLNIAIVVRTVKGQKVYSWGTFNQDIARWADDSDSNEIERDIFWDRSFLPGEEFRVTLSVENNLGAGEYEVQVVVSRELDRLYGSQQILHWRDEMGFFRVEMNLREYLFGGLCDLHGVATFHG